MEGLHTKKGFGGIKFGPKFFTTGGNMCGANPMGGWGSPLFLKEAGKKFLGKIATRGFWGLKQGGQEFGNIY